MEGICCTPVVLFRRQFLDDNRLNLTRQTIQTGPAPHLNLIPAETAVMLRLTILKEEHEDPEIIP